MICDPERAMAGIFFSLKYHHKQAARPHELQELRAIVRRERLGVIRALGGFPLSLIKQVRNGPSHTCGFCSCVIQSWPLGQPPLAALPLCWLTSRRGSGCWRLAAENKQGNAKAAP
jgi:hypothetical protein